MPSPGWAPPRRLPRPATDFLPALPTRPSRRPADRQGGRRAIGVTPPRQPPPAARVNVSAFILPGLGPVQASGFTGRFFSPPMPRHHRPRPGPDSRVPRVGPGTGRPAMSRRRMPSPCPAPRLMPGHPCRAIATAVAHSMVCHIGACGAAFAPSPWQWEGRGGIGRGTNGPAKSSPRLRRGVRPDPLPALAGPTSPCQGEEIAGSRGKSRRAPHLDPSPGPRPGPARRRKG